jgi:hypothetical protein
VLSGARGLQKRVHCLPPLLPPLPASTACLHCLPPLHVLCRPSKLLCPSPPPAALALNPPAAAARHPPPPLARR